MNPSIGRIVHFNVHGVGWRPMLITGVHPEVEATDGSTNPPCISGWVTMDPDDAIPADGDFNLQHLPLLPIKRGYEEGTKDVTHGWRWPPRV